MLETIVILANEQCSLNRYSLKYNNRAAHGGWTFEWPVTKILEDAAAVKDSYRELHPDPVKEPGSWCPAGLR